MGFFCPSIPRSLSCFCTQLLSTMKILVACERTGTMQKVLTDLGHTVLSCDTQKPLHNMPFYQGDVREILSSGWDAMIGFPPCTYLTKAQESLVKKSPARQRKQLAAAEFFKELYHSPIPQVVLENPPGALSRLFRQPDQIVQPWYHGDPYFKQIGLWLKNCPPVIASLYSTERRSMSNHTNGRMSQDQKSNIKSSWAYFPRTAYQIGFQMFGSV